LCTVYHYSTNSMRAAVLRDLEAPVAAAPMSMAA
jgi:hypothetical protein